MANWFKKFLAPKNTLQIQDAFGIIHTLTIRQAQVELKEYWDEWPGGLEEIQAALKVTKEQLSIAVMVLQKFQPQFGIESAEPVSRILITKGELDECLGLV